MGGSMASASSSFLSRLTGEMVRDIVAFRMSTISPPSKHLWGTSCLSAASGLNPFQENLISYTKPLYTSNITPEKTCPDGYPLELGTEFLPTNYEIGWPKSGLRLVV